MLFASAEVPGAFAINSIRSRWALMLAVSSWTAASNSWWVLRAMERAEAHVGVAVLVGFSSTCPAKPIMIVGAIGIRVDGALEARDRRLKSRIS